MEISLFSHVKDNEPKKLTLTFEELYQNVCSDLAPILGITPSMPAEEAKGSLYAFSPTLWMPGYTRGRNGISRMECIALDFDNSDKSSGVDRCFEKPARPEQIHEYLKALQVSHCIYTSFSHNKGGQDWPKFRVIIPISEYAHSHLWSETVDWILASLGLNFWSYAIDIPAVKDVARLYFLSASYYGPIQSWYYAGKEVLLDHEYITDVYNANQITHPAPIYTGPKAGDLSVSELVSLVESYGCQVDRPQKIRNGVKYMCECPLSGEHSNGIKEGAAIFHFDTGGCGFSCFHTHQLNLKKLLSFHRSASK